MKIRLKEAIEGYELDAEYRICRSGEVYNDSGIAIICNHVSHMPCIVLTPIEVELKPGFYFRNYGFCLIEIREGVEGKITISRGVESTNRISKLSHQFPRNGEWTWLPESSAVVQGYLKHRIKLPKADADGVWHLGDLLFVPIRLSRLRDPHMAYRDRHWTVKNGDVVDIDCKYHRVCGYVHGEPHLERPTQGIKQVLSLPDSDAKYVVLKEV